MKANLKYPGCKVIGALEKSIDHNPNEAKEEKKNEKRMKKSKQTSYRNGSKVGQATRCSIIEILILF